MDLGKSRRGIERYLEKSLLSLGTPSSDAVLWQGGQALYDLLLPPATAKGARERFESFLERIPENLPEILNEGYLPYDEVENHSPDEENERRKEEEMTPVGEIEDSYPFRSLFVKMLAGRGEGTTIAAAWNDGRS